MSDNEILEEKSFAELFEGGPQIPQGWVSPGDTVSGKVIKISKDTIFIDLGGKSEGTADIEEFKDADGKLTLQEGDTVELRVSSVRRGVHLSKAIKVHGAEAIETLREAQRNQIPVEGRVAGVNKGGFDVEIAGLKAFCPISQIGLAYCEKPEEHIGGRYPFRIMEMEERGKNIILSRRVLLREEQEKKAQETLAKLTPGLELEGKVTRLMAFGAFVDLGGIEGMVHISEISQIRIQQPSEVLATGQVVKVKILRMEPDKAGRPRIALSIKALEPEIWEKGFAFQEGEVIAGKVTRLADFGAFVEIAPGFEGLVHVSEISYERVRHPSRVLKIGDPVEVLVQKIDEANHRISLSIKDALIKQRMAEDPAAAGKVNKEVGQVLRGIVEDQKPYGLFVRLPQLGMEVRGLLPNEELIESEKGDVKKKFPKGKEIQVEIAAIDGEGRIRLSQRSIREKEDRHGFVEYLGQKHKGGGMGTLGDIFKKLDK